METIQLAMILASLVYLSIMVTVVFVSENAGLGLKEFLSSTKSALLNEGLGVLLSSSQIALGNFLWSSQIALGNFLWSSQNVIGNFLWSSQNVIGNFLWLSYTAFEEIFCTMKFIYVLLSGISIEFIIGWIYVREEMKLMTKSAFDEGKLVLPPIQEAFCAFWKIVSNPWKLLGYTLFIFLVNMRPEAWTQIISAAQKGQKL